MSAPDVKTVAKNLERGPVYVEATDPATGLSVIVYQAAEESHKDLVARATAELKDKVAAHRASSGEPNEQDLELELSRRLRTLNAKQAIVDVCNILEQDKDLRDRVRKALGVR